MFLHRSRRAVRRRSSYAISVASRGLVVEALEGRTLLSVGPATPTLSAAVASSPARIDLAYSESDGSHLELEEQAPGDANFHVIADLGTAASGSYSVAAAGGASYSFRLRADLNGQVAYASASASTDPAPDPGDPGGPDAPSGVSVDNASGAYVGDVHFTADYGPQGSDTPVYAEYRRSDDLYGLLGIGATLGYDNDPASLNGSPPPPAGQSAQYLGNIQEPDVLPTAGVAYQVRLRAFDPNTDLASDWSGPASYTAPEPDGTQPTGIWDVPAISIRSGPGATSGTVAVTWDTPSAPAEPAWVPQVYGGSPQDWQATWAGFFNVYVFRVDPPASGASGPGTATYVGGGALGDDAATVPAGPPGSKLFAVPECGIPLQWGKYSNAVDGTGAAPAPPAAPAHLSATPYADGNSHGVRLLWDNTPSTETSYTVQRATDAAFTQNVTSIAGGGADSVVVSDTDVADATTYYYRAYATNAGGNSDYSNVASVVGATAIHGPQVYDIGWIETTAGEAELNAVANSGPPPDHFDEVGEGSIGSWEASQQYRDVLAVQVNVVVDSSTHQILSDTPIVTQNVGYTPLPGNIFVQGDGSSSVTEVYSADHTSLTVTVLAKFRVAAPENAGYALFHGHRLAWAWSEVIYSIDATKEVADIKFKGSYVPSQSYYINNSLVGGYSMASNVSGVDAFLNSDYDTLGAGDVP